MAKLLRSKSSLSASDPLPPAPVSPNKMSRRSSCPSQNLRKSGSQRPMEKHTNVDKKNLSPEEKILKRIGLMSEDQKHDLVLNFVVEQARSCKATRQVSDSALTKKVRGANASLPPRYMKRTSDTTLSTSQSTSMSSFAGRDIESSPACAPLTPQRTSCKRTTSGGFFHRSNASPSSRGRMSFSSVSTFHKKLPDLSS